MKRLMMTSLVAAGLLFTMTEASYAQLAKQNLTMRQIETSLNELVNKGDAASKAQLVKEAKAFAASKNETYHSMAIDIYRYLGDDKAAEKVQNGILKKFPNGATARSSELSKIFRNDESSIDQKATAYQAWLKRFPRPESGGTRDYSMAASMMAQAFVKAGRTADALNLVKGFEGTPDYYTVVNSVGGELNRSEKYTDAVKVFEAAAKAIEKESNRNFTHNAILSAYATALIKSGDVQKGIELTKASIERAGARASAGDYQNLSAAYQALGRDLDAFQAIENYLTAGNFNAKLAESLEPLYNKLNNNKGDFKAYLADLDGRITKALKAKYKESMVERDAPGFTLKNMKGETVSLKDYLGKIVIIDFWATWCGPCVMSFPGMQAAVNKYANDPEVEFLFINTWQSEPNYEEVVEKFIAEKGYNFHVVYDEMKERDKAAVTAYGVRGIPTKVFIDQKGKIRFQSSGGSADVSVVVGEMDAKIELIKEAVAREANAQ